MYCQIISILKVATEWSAAERREERRRDHGKTDSAGVKANSKGHSCSTEYTPYLALLVILR